MRYSPLDSTFMWKLNAQKAAEPSVSSMCFPQMNKSDVLTHLLVLPLHSPNVASHVHHDLSST